MIAGRNGAELINVLPTPIPAAERKKSRLRQPTLCMTSREEPAVGEKRLDMVSFGFSKTYAVV